MQRRAVRGLLALPLLLSLAACAAPRPVPLPDGGVVDANRASATQTRDGLTVTVRARAWTGTPGDLEDHVLPLHVVVRNDTGAGVSVAPRDIVLLDDEGRQYSARPPGEVAQLLQAYAVGAVPPVIFAPWPHRYALAYPYFYDPFYGPLGPWWWYPSPRYRPVQDIFGLAFQGGDVRPDARHEGFVYFPRPLPSARRFDVIVGYRVEGAPARAELRFPFALERDGA